MVQLPVTGGAYAIILAGGRSARMGRPKRDLTLDGRSLLARAVDACTGRAVVVAVTPELPSDVDAERVLRTCEDPPFGGPVAGITAGLAVLPPAGPDDEVLLLACDLALVKHAVLTLDGATLGLDGACLVDADDYRQYLAARYRRAALSSALANGDPRNRSVKRTLGALRLALVAAPGLTADLDTPADAAAAGVPAPDFHPPA